MQTIDVTGLPESVVRSIEQLVATVRQNLASAPTEQSAEEWVAAFRVWAASHPVREVEIEDDRESLYAGRGE